MGSNITHTSSSPDVLTADASDGLRLTIFRPDIGREPWVLDGAGLRLIEDVVPGTGSLRASGLLVHSGRTLVTPRNPDAAHEPYIWDGTLVQQINLLGSGDSFPSGLFPLDDFVLTVAENAFGDRVLWAIDPITLNTEELTATTPRAVLPAGEVAFFSDGNDLWKTDGTAAGTALVMTLFGRVDASGVIADAVGAAAPLAIFGLGGGEVWASDGTLAGTVLLLSGLRPFSFISGRFEPMGNRLLFSAESASGAFGELYVTDGTIAGTQQLTTREADGGFSSREPRVLASNNIGWFYQDSRDDSGSELWFTDGTATTQLEIAPGPVSGYRSNFSDVPAMLGNQLVLSAYRSDRGSELWLSDGTVSGTVPLGEVLPGPAGQPLVPVASGNRVFFSAVGTEGKGRELWFWEPPLFSDGFEAGDTAAWQ